LAGRTRAPGTKAHRLRERQQRQSTARVFDEDVVPVDETLVPLSDHFGIRSVIVVP